MIFSLIPNLFNVILLFALSNVYCIKQNAKSVTTLIDAKWEVTPLVLEVAEYVDDESKDDFWNYLNDVSKLSLQLIELESDKLHYETALKLAGKYLSELQLKMLKLALSLHIFSPKIEMFAQMASECGVPESRCPSAIHFNNRLFCDSDEFVQYFKQKGSKETVKPEVYDIDHVYPGSENNSHVAILYAELGTPEFTNMHYIMKELASKNLLTYVFRHYVKERPNKRVRLSGYGVELQMKSTEYKVMDDVQVQANDSTSVGETEDPDEEIEGLNFYKLKNLYPEQKDELDKLRSHLLETSNEMAPLKVWQVQELSLQAAERILSFSSGEEALKMLTHIAHNFPLQARSLIRTRVRPELKKEILKNQQVFDATLNLSPSDAAIFINGMYFDVEILDVISLLEVLREELRTVEKLHNIGVEEEEIKNLISLDLTTSSSEYAIDIRDSAVVWFNDIESDKQYRKWSDSLLDLLRPTFPGMLRSIKRNLYNLVAIVDPSKKESKPLLKLMESFYLHVAPLRLGIVFAVTPDPSRTGLNDSGIAMLNAFNYVSEAKNPYGGLSFITDVYASVSEDDDVTAKDIQKKLKEKYPQADIDQVFGEDTAYDTGRKLSAVYIERSGFRRVPQALLNGIPLSEKRLNAEEFEEGVLSEIMSQTPQLQKAVFKEEFVDTDSAIDYLMNRPNVMPRLNERILSENARYLDLTGNPSFVDEVSDYEKLSGRDKTATLLKNMKYFVRKAGRKKPDLITHWIVADFDVPTGRNMLKSALDQMRSSSGIRVGIIVNPESAVVSPITELILTALGVLESEVATSYIFKILENEEVFESLDGFKRPPNFFLPGLDVNLVGAELQAGKMAKKIVSLHRIFVRSVLKFDPGQRGVVTNGRVFGPFDQDETFVADDFALLDRFCYNNFGKKVTEALGVRDDKMAADGDEAGGDLSYLTSDGSMQVISILASRSDPRMRFKIPFKWTDQFLGSLIIPPANSSLPSFDIVAIFDPVSKGAQKIGPILTVLRDAVNSRIRIFLNCVEKNSDLPLKSFYKYVLESELQFHPDGRLTSGPGAKFSNLPDSVLFTQNMHVPENWIVESIRSPYDLDNIKLDSVLQNTVHSEFELEYLLLEGHCFEALMGNPPRGLQITLGTEMNPVKYDTIVMANLGYFQLKANPGAWKLRLREGRSSEIYNIISSDGSDNPVNATEIKVIISSFRSHVLKLRVQKKPDKMRLDLLSDEDPGTGIWNSIASSFGSKAEEIDDVINVFSLASGHLYERFIKIMMLSVVKHTKTPVKFWFLKNYLSPTLKDFLPHMAKEYGFDYELVEYKWPRWLHQQSEKQRTIWGYKILFLDVLFPLHVKKIIFVDADQVVRADLKELRDLDLGGASYGYTPFCNSRKEMDGFRFWNQGYWRNHLQGRRYHISALYVVDLKRFRRIAAGDRLRGQYQALSKDPNSLSNLDQDLPNNMIHQVAIKSLPEEWLWCETWCDDASKAYAKTIDLCNNPLTKEAKLTAAMRIIEEWKDYDHEIKELERRIDLNSHAEEITGKPSPEPIHHVHTEL